MNNTKYFKPILGKNGLYRITNKKNWKKYIGQSNNIDLEERNIFWDLKKGECSLKALQEEYDMYGPDAFTFEILLECPEEELDERQANLIRLYRADDPRAGYNL